MKINGSRHDFYYGRWVGYRARAGGGAAQGGESGDYFGATQGAPRRSGEGESRDEVCGVERGRSEEHRVGGEEVDRRALKAECDR